MTMESFHPLLWPNNKILMFCNNKFINMFTDFLVVFWLDLDFRFNLLILFCLHLNKFIVLYYLSKCFLEKSTLFFIIGLSQTFQQHSFDSFFSVSSIFQNLYKFKIKGIPLYLFPGFKNINFYFSVFFEKIVYFRNFSFKSLSTNEKFPWDLEISNFSLKS